MSFHRPSSEELQQRRLTEREANMRALGSGPRSLHRGTYGGATTVPAPPARQKVPGKVKQAIRDSARGEACAVRLIGVCNHNPETTVWSHYPGHAGDRGMGTKSLDLAGCYACSACHDAVDGRTRYPGLDALALRLAWHEAHLRSLVRLAQKGLL
ncbi:MAG TPA: nuclease domain-containing protein [Ramlibacter sp.]|nr:nuclease domain-containing protein [Ramlibacter sp.]HYE40346.1 nuclease domain-containing protein [Ramlibacter sp.]